MSLSQTTLKVSVRRIMKIIPLSQDEVAIVDDEDFERLNQSKWSFIQSGKTGYAVTKRNKRRVWMHREILGAATEIDHVNGIGTDNRKENLRQCTRSQNCANRRKLQGCLSKFKGVHWHGYGWIARLQKRDVSGRQDKRSLGVFQTQQEAALAYNKAAKETYGDFALLNEVK